MTDELEIEEIKRSDREEIESLSEGIWDGWDYIPDLFDDWMEDGGFICGKKDGKIIALAKHTRHDDDVLWLEGLRVHPDHQGEGYGREMIEGQMEYIDDLDYSAARFLTTGDKSPVRKVVEDIGFELKKEYDYLRLDEEELEEMEIAEKDEIEMVKQETDAEEAYDFVLSSPEKDDYEGLYIEGWTAYSISKELIGDRVEKGKCYSVREEGEVKALMFTYVNEIYDSKSIPFIAGPKEKMKRLLKFGIKEAIEQERRTFRLKTGSKRVVEAAQEVGLKFSDHGCTVVYEKKAERSDE
ncbi:MAG: GNAT family N-acetyltransferase [Candidatus Thermoplasmatota archaeon]